MIFRYNSLLSSLETYERAELHNRILSTAFCCVKRSSILVHYTTPYEMKGKTITTHLKFSHFSKGD